MKAITNAINTLKIEANAIISLIDHLTDSFEDVVQRIADNKGRVIISGIGKSAIIGQKIVATMNSTGTPSYFLHAADAIHGDLGMIQSEDIIICISNSGNTGEIKVLVPFLQKKGNLLIGMTGNKSSFLAKQADYMLYTGVEKEACPNNLAPTASTTAQLAIGDALAVAVLNMKQFSNEDFAKNHPGGSLGKQLYLLVDDIYALNQKPFVARTDSIREVILSMSNGRLGATIVVENDTPVGIITDGDLRRMMERHSDLSHVQAKDIMGTNPVVIEVGNLAKQAMIKMKSKNINQIVVVQEKKYVGVIHLHDLLKEGLA